MSRPSPASRITFFPCSGKSTKNAEHISEHPEVLNSLPDSMKTDIKKAGDCKKLTGSTCTPTCPAGYTFVMDGQEYRKCRNMAFFHSLTAGNMEHILKLIHAELG